MTSLSPSVLYMSIVYEHYLIYSIRSVNNGDYQLCMRRYKDRSHSTKIPTESLFHFCDSVIIMKILFLAFALLATLANAAKVDYTGYTQQWKLTWFFVCFYLIHFLEIKLRNFSLLINRHKVIRVVPQTEDQLRFLLKLQEGTYDFWSSPSKLDAPVDIRVSPQR